MEPRWRDFHALSRSSRAKTVSANHNPLPELAENSGISTPRPIMKAVLLANSDYYDKVKEQRPRRMKQNKRLKYTRSKISRKSLTKLSVTIKLSQSFGTKSNSKLMPAPPGLPLHTHKPNKKGGGCCFCVLLHKGCGHHNVPSTDELKA